MNSLEGKTVLILGGAGLIGASISDACARAGGRVVIADIDENKGAALAQKTGASFEKADIADLASLDALARKIGTVDCLVNAAYPKSKNFGRSFEEANVADMLDDLALQVGGCLSAVKAFGPLMQKAGAGSIVFLGSIYGIASPRFDIYEGTNMTLPAEYAAIKGGVIALCRYFASLLGKSGVRCNAVSPGGVADGQPESFVERYSSHLKIGHGLLSPEDIAGAVVFLLSDDSKQITGQNIVVDGGWTI